MGLFGNSGLLLGISGPSGTIFAYGLVAAGVICIMEGISELIGHWPISNAMVEFVRSFVDKEFALVIGFGYWYCKFYTLSEICWLANFSKGSLLNQLRDTYCRSSELSDVLGLGRILAECRLHILSAGYPSFLELSRCKGMPYTGFECFCRPSSDNVN